MADFTANFKRLRKEAHLEQAEIAARLGLAKSTVSMYERGQRRPNLTILAGLAEIFDVTVDELIGYAEPEPLQPNEIRVTDPELIEYLELLRTRPECRMLMSTVRTATKAQIAANVAFIESLRAKEE